MLFRNEILEENIVGTGVKKYTVKQARVEGVSIVTSKHHAVIGVLDLTVNQKWNQKFQEDYNQAIGFL